MRTVNNPASIIQVLDADDVAVVLEALESLIRTTDLDDAKGDRAWAIREAIRATANGDNQVRIGETA